MSLGRRIFLERRAIIIALAVLILGNLAVLGFVVLPSRSSVSAAAARVQESAHDLAMAQLMLRNVQDQRTSKELAELQLKRFYAEVLPTGYPEAQDLTNFGLEHIARQAGVSLKNGVNDYEPNKDSRLVRVIGRVVFDGTYFDIRRFLFALETARPFVIVERVELSESNTSQASAGPQNAGSKIEITLNVASYYLAVPAGASAGAGQ